MTETTTFLEKYCTIIAEEVNVKDVGLLGNDISVSITYAPIGKELSTEFGKDTGTIIAAAKQGKITTHTDGTLTVHGEGTDRLLQDHQYETRYSGLSGDNQLVEDGVIVELDLDITDELKVEGIAREISRFLNQMRKEADYAISDRVACYWQTKSPAFTESLTTYADFLQAEALLATLENKEIVGDITSTFSLDGEEIVFSLQK